MTSPDGASPSGASGYANVGDLQDVTQETVDGLYRTPLQDKIATQQGDALNWIMAPVNALGSAIFQGWFGVSGLPDQSAALKAEYTLGAVKDAVLNGYIVHTMTSSETFTVTDEMSELIVVLVGSGENGQTPSGSAGGLGGAGGGHLVKVFDPQAVLMGSTSREVEVTVGSGMGAGSYFGNLLVVDNQNSSPVPTFLGYLPNASTPGQGGKGGDKGLADGYWQYTGSPPVLFTTPPSAGSKGATGTTSALGPGGPGGTSVVNGHGTRGTDGGTVSPASYVKCGGGGGGGGGGSSGNGEFGNTYSGGAGGNGGYPGGGGGGGGGAGGTKGGGGVGAPGCAWVFYRKKL